MIVYEPIIAHDYECLSCCDDDDSEVFHTFDGWPQIETWRPILVDSGPVDERQKGLPSDFPWLASHVLVMRKRAVVALRDIFEAHGELLPILTDDGVELFALNLRTVDALDESRSEILLSPDTGGILLIEKVAFIDSKIEGLDIFRLPYRGNPVYVSQHFVDRVKQAGLVGLDFDQVWPRDSES